MTKLEEIISDYLTGEGHPREDADIDATRLARMIWLYFELYPKEGDEK